MPSSSLQTPSTTTGHSKQPLINGKTVNSISKPDIYLPTFFDLGDIQSTLINRHRHQHNNLIIHCNAFSISSPNYHFPFDIELDSVTRLDGKVNHDFLWIGTGSGLFAYGYEDALDRIRNAGRLEVQAVNYGTHSFVFDLDGLDEAMIKYMECS